MEYDSACAKIWLLKAFTVLTCVAFKSHPGGFFITELCSVLFFLQVLFYQNQNSRAGLCTHVVWIFGAEVIKRHIYYISYYLNLNNNVDHTFKKEKKFIVKDDIISMAAWLTLYIPALSLFCFSAFARHHLAEPSIHLPHSLHFYLHWRRFWLFTETCRWSFQSAAVSRGRL